MSFSRALLPSRSCTFLPQCKARLAAYSHPRSSLAVCLSVSQVEQSPGLTCKDTPALVTRSGAQPHIPLPIGHSIPCHPNTTSQMTDSNMHVRKCTALPTRNP